jgi:hypothetical protein
VSNHQSGIAGLNVVRIPSAESQAFRRSIIANAELIEDVWDQHAEHVALCEGDVTIATFRLVHPSGRRLPVSEHDACLPVADEDRQVGRLITTRSRWTLNAGLFFFAEYTRLLSEIPGRIYVATANWGPISPKRYQTLGFRDTGVRYSDARYPDEMIVLVRRSNLAPDDKE